MNGPTCYKCGTEEQLSVKRTLKTGHMLFICRPCRRAVAKQYNEVRLTEDRPNPSNQKAWAAWAKAKHQAKQKVLAEADGRLGHRAQA